MEGAVVQQLGAPTFEGRKQTQTRLFFFLLLLTPSGYGTAPTYFCTAHDCLPALTPSLRATVESLVLCVLNFLKLNLNSIVWRGELLVLRFTFFIHSVYTVHVLGRFFLECVYLTVSKIVRRIYGAIVK